MESFLLSHLNSRTDQENRNGSLNCLSEGDMTVSTRRSTRFLWVLLLLVAIVGLLAVWGIWLLWGFWSSRTPTRDDTPTQLASVPVTEQPTSLAWSADGGYLAAGTPVDEKGSCQVFVVDVGRAAITATLKATGWVQGPAFSPDGKWLAVATRRPLPTDPAAAELVVFDVPAFTPKLTAKTGGAETGFNDLAWAADSKSLYAIEGPAEYVQGNADIRRWDVPAFTEQPAIRVPQTLRGLAVSPDGRTLAVAEKTASNARVIRLFDLGQGKEQSSFKSGDDNGTPRLGFTSDGKSLGVFDGHQQTLTWWEVATGRPAKPNPARFAIQPAGLGDDSSHSSLSPDGSLLARGYERHRGFGDLGWDNRQKEFGGFVDLTEAATAKTRTWRVSDAQLAPPAVAFSPDGTKLAGTVRQPSGGAILIWAVPK
jgi:WD40 repeat protein